MQQAMAVLAGETIIAGNDMLCVGEFCIRRRAISCEGTERLGGSRLALLEILWEFFGLFLKLFEVGLCG